ncbi:M23 family metallopeptidase [Nocardiopsis alba]|uniref:M23 family metallopeptidase n=1 Tax=Nocardiopsis alba TaxID=53437 RepID=UPI0035DA8150
MSHPRFWALPLFLSLLLFPFFHTRTALAAPVDETGRRWPLAEPVSVLRGFDPPEQRWLPGHLGVDLAAEPGREVYAAAPGRVHFAGPVAGVGVVSVAHGDVRTTYLPVDASVSRGDPVGPDPIGTLSEEPFHCRDRPCLHWGLLRGDTYLDPLSLLGRGEIRLLPLHPPGPGPTAPSGEGVALRPGRRVESRRGSRDRVHGRISTDPRSSSRVRRGLGDPHRRRPPERVPLPPFHSEEEVGSRRIPGCSNEQPDRVPLT